MQCPICKADTYVQSTTGQERRRKCTGCGQRFTTVEVLKDELDCLHELEALLADALRQAKALRLLDAMPARKINEPEPRGPGYVYFIQQAETWAVKIGYTSSSARLVSRLAALQTASPYPLQLIHAIPAADDRAERELHERFAAHRIGGEWFRPSGEMAEWLAEQKASA